MAKNLAEALKPVREKRSFYESNPKLVEEIIQSGDDKARKIKFSGNQMIVSGTAFNYNLQASSEKPETVYTFIWLPKEQKWGLIQYQ